MINTVTISIYDYEKLKDAQKTIDEQGVYFKGSFGYYRFMKHDEAINEIKREMDSLRLDVRTLKSRNIIQRIFNI